MLVNVTLHDTVLGQNTVGASHDIVQMSVSSDQVIAENAGLQMWQLPCERC